MLNIEIKKILPQMFEKKGVTNYNTRVDVVDKSSWTAIEQTNLQ